MPDFEISLKEFSLSDILQFLAQLKKTGVVRISGEVKGEIYLSEGLVVHSTDGSEKGLEALLNLSFASLEKAQFEANAQPSEQTISDDIGKLSENIEKRRIEFQSIKDRLPPRDTVLAKSTRDLESAVALRRTDWQILALVDGKRNLNEVISQSKLGGYEATKTIVWLKDQGLIYDPRENERIMAGMVDYLKVVFKHFGKNGLNWLKRWAEKTPENKGLCDAVTVNEETLEISVSFPLTAEQIDQFLAEFDGQISQEGPQLYGKLLFKKKLDEFRADAGRD
jgi:hypothetical protein